MKEYVYIKLQVKIGDIITSKKGIIFVSPLTGQLYKVKKVKALGFNTFEVIGHKEVVE